MGHIKTIVDLAEIARSARAALGWSQQQVADAAGVSRRFVNLLEGGQHEGAEISRVLAVLDAAGVRLDGALPADRPEALSGEQTSAGEIDLDAYLSTFRAAEVSR